MKSFSLLMLPAALAMVACETMNAPLSSSSFDPLRPPGTGLQDTSQSDSGLTPGQFVTVSIPNTPFYKDKPKDNQDADKLLDVGTAMKVVSVESNFVKVEMDSGETGYVPSVMINTSSEESIEYLPGDGMFPVYPPLPEGGGVEPLPMLDPNGLPPSDAIPTIIDPDAPIPDPTAPITIDPIPELKEPTAPVEEKSEDAADAAEKEEAPEE
ncbi:MAG: hypothetical protein NWT08_02240 [Akkermansiaceae bacterium]|jgi:hypothetical protein|nr:hypothetical protein [Akkermansiaceae bacterium]MDP4647486.1 hypothetical protein [Akkermansiaceae bacterium]MDP4722542.1 hypothetical protein [Akkermansiaceae bacterium]MDP4779271.1 hypothetical protein [Akkermansiaceae bacterium]MDP4845978.1 hypothetical protein [Akkermansiaceae bacterium]